MLFQEVLEILFKFDIFNIVFIFPYIHALLCLIHLQ